MHWLARTAFPLRSSQLFQVILERSPPLRWRLVFQIGKRNDLVYVLWHRQNHPTRYVQPKSHCRVHAFTIACTYIPHETPEAITETPP